VFKALHIIIIGGTGSPKNNGFVSSFYHAGIGLSM
jgi:hypothetical protein